MSLTYTTVTVRHVANRARAVAVADVLVDTGSEATWIARQTLESINVAVEVGRERTFVMADGRHLTRSTGYAMLQTDPDFETVDIVVFAEPGDLQLLGGRTIEGFNAKVDLAKKQLVAAGPMPAAANTRTNTKD